MKNLFFSLLALGLICSSCGDKNKGSGNNTLSPEKQKSVLSQIGVDLAKSIDVNELEPLKTAVVELSGLLGQDAEVEDEGVKPPVALGQFSSTVGQIVQGETLNPMPYWGSLARSSSSLSLSKNFGTYTYNTATKEFDKTPASDGVYVVYPCGGQLVNISCKPSTDFHTVEGANGQTVEVPKSTTITMVQGQTTLMKAEVKLPTLAINTDNPTDKNNTLKAEIKLSLMNYNLEMNANVLSAKVELAAKVSKGSGLLFAINASADANKSGSSVYEGSVGAMRVQASVLDRLFVKASTPNMSEYSEKMEKVNTDREEAALFNQYFSVFCNFDNSNNAAFTLKAHESGAYPVMIFSDGSQYRVEDYFETGFDEVGRAFENLAESFEEFFYL